MTNTTTALEANVQIRSSVPTFWAPDVEVCGNSERRGAAVRASKLMLFPILVCAATASVVPLFAQNAGRLPTVGAPFNDSHKRLTVILSLAQRAGVVRLDGKAKIPYNYTRREGGLA